LHENAAIDSEDERESSSLAARQWLWNGKVSNGNRCFFLRGSILH